MKFLIGVLVIVSILMLVTSVSADEVEFRTVVKKNDMSVGGEFSLYLQMRITAGYPIRKLYSFTADISYGSELTNPTATDWASNLSTDGYELVSQVIPGSHYRLGCFVFRLTGDGWDVTTDWQNVVTVTWTIAATSSVNISIRDITNEAEYFNHFHNNSTLDDSFPGQHAAWIVSNQDAGDISLPVELSSFTAIYIYDGCELEWTTQTEVNNIGFYIYRSENEDGEYTRVNEKIIEGNGNSAMPKTYKYIDDSVDLNIDTYFYYLENIGIFGIKDKSKIIKISRKKVSKLTAEYHKNSVDLKWSVEPQFYIPAWNVYRSTEENGAYIKLDKPKIDYDNQTQTYSYTEPFTDEYFHRHSIDHLYYYVEGIDSEKRPLMKSRPIKVEIIPDGFALLQNYPNPYNPETWIPYQLPKDTTVTIKIYNVIGHLVKTLSLGEKIAGMYISRDRAAYWDGRNEASERVSNGLYFYAIEAGDFRSIKRMLLVK